MCMNVFRFIFKAVVLLILALQSTDGRNVDTNKTASAMPGVISGLFNQVSLIISHLSI